MTKGSGIQRIDNSMCVGVLKLMSLQNAVNFSKFILKA